MRDSTRTVLRSTVVDVPIQRQHYVAEIGRLLDNPAAATDAAIAAFQEITTQTTLPVLQAIRCTGDGEVWVDRFAEPGSSTRSVLLFDRKNNLVGSMQLPTEYRLLDATRDRMLIARPNEDAIPIIEVIAVRLNN